MDIYHFQPPSPVAQVEFTQDAKKVWIARLFPQPGAGHETLAGLTSILNQRQDGIIAVPQSAKGVHTLYASGFESPQSLLSHLAQTGHTQGPATHEKVSKEAEAFTGKIRDASLKLAGIFYLLSDAALAVSGVMSGRYKETIAGALYSTGGVVLARYGRKDAHVHLQDLSLKMGDFFTREGIAIPKDGAIMGANSERPHAMIEGLERFAYRYPSQIFNTFVATCGVQLIQSGMIHKKPWDTTSGALVLGGALAGLIIPEKTNQVQMPRQQEEKKQAHDPISKLFAWVQEKPLRIPGYLWFGNNIALTISAIKERQQNRKQRSYMFKFAYAAAAVIANGLMSISSKQAGGRFDIDSDSMQALLAVAANVIIQQQQPVQEHIIQQVAGFMASQPDMPCSATDLAAAMRAQVAELAANPFLPDFQASLAVQKPAPCFVSQYTRKPSTDWKTSDTIAHSATSACSLS